MNNHRYNLEPYHGISTRHTCPECKESRVFSLYIDTETGLIVHSSVGRCNRESNCGYHYTPKEYFQNNNISIDTNHCQLKREPETKRPTSYILLDTMESSLRGYGQNNFVQFLNGLFGVKVTADALQKYFVGTSKHWPGSTVFWQIDIKNRIRTGKIILYNQNTGKRVKDPFSFITWVHSVLKQSNFEMKQCLFGEHLLNEASLPIGLVESEKTAIIASLCLPSFTWLATGGLSNLTAEKCRVLSGRTVVLFPDVLGFDKWQRKAKELSILIPGTHFEISDLLEKNATDEERKEGCDIADYLIKSKIKPLTEEENTLRLFIEKNPNLSKLTKLFDLSLTNLNYSAINI